MFVAVNYAESQTPRTQNSKDFAIMVHTTTSENPPSITLHWQLLPETQSIEVSRKLKNETAWTRISTLDSGITEFTDNNVQVGIAYEYQVLGKSQMYKKIDANNNGWMPYYCTGYTYTGINVPPSDLGKVLLIVEDELSDKLDDKIAQLEYDMQAEGWTTLRRYAPRTEAFDGAAVKNVKNIILEEYNKDPNNLSAVLLLGRIAVPYSGDFNPDAHPDHKGAWPADTYYGILNENFWTDNSVNTTVATRDENKNLLGDGKFDQSNYQNETVKLQIGRVDLYNMPAFYNATTGKGTEVDLISNYLDKNHNYRTGQVEYINKGIVSDGFSTMEEAFASSGWRNFGCFFTADSVETGNWVSTPDSTKTYLWAYGCAGGNYKGYGLGNTVDFAKKNSYTIFTMLFGSYFGDWDHDDAFLRAPLASKATALTCGWSGRPHWYLHYMGLGEPIGSAYLLSANNSSTYLPNLYYNINYGGWFIYAIGMKNVHIALMGDPTLRMNYQIVKPPKNLSLNLITDRKLELTWESSSDKDVKYFVYRAINGIGMKKVMSAYTLLNKEPISGNSFIDSTIFNGDLHYKVVASVLQHTTGSGSYFTPSAYIRKNTLITDVNEIPDIEFALSASPNPADFITDISFSLNKTGYVDLAIYDLSGNIIKSLYNNFISAGSQKLSWDLSDDNGNKVSSGVYFIKISSEGITKVEKIIVR
jgi:hypothetical protein